MGKIWAILRPWHEFKWFSTFIDILHTLSWKCSILKVMHKAAHKTDCSSWNLRLYTNRKSRLNNVYFCFKNTSLLAICRSSNMHVCLFKRKTNHKKYWFNGPKKAKKIIGLTYILSLIGDNYITQPDKKQYLHEAIFMLYGWATLQIYL